MDADLRDYFDEQLEETLGKLPRLVHDLLAETPLFVEDHPSQAVLRKLGIRRRDELCGLYSGIPITERSIEQSGIPTDAIYVFREGILSLVAGHDGLIDEVALREQIRITILHELGHLHGMSESELRALGYG